MSGDINVQTFSGKVNISNNLKVGSGHLFVDTLNNQVGLNTNDPQANLHVNGNTYVHTNFRVGSGIIMNETSGRITAGSFVGDGSALQGINSDSGSWVNGASSNVHLATTGDSVGIGVVDPQYKLDVAGDINITSGSTLRVGGTPAVFSNWTVNGDDISRSSGNVGIGGSASATNKLKVTGTIESTTGFAGIQASDVPTLSAYATTSALSDGLATKQASGDYAALAGSTSQAFSVSTLTTNGDVGIGTTDPTELLDITAASGTDAFIRLRCSGGDTGESGLKLTESGEYGFQFTHSAVTDLLKIKHQNSAGAVDLDDIMVWNPNGNVGIGKTDPDAKLHVNGNVIVGDVGAYGSLTHQDAQLTLGGTHNAGYNLSNKVKLLISGGDNDGSSPYYIMCEDENGYDQFFLKGATSQGGASAIMYLKGKVGIGTTSPSYNLDVSGNLRVTTGIVDTSWCSGSWYQTCTQSPTVTVYSNNGGGPMSAPGHGGGGMGGNRGRFTAKKAGNYLISCCAVHMGRGGADATGTNLLVVFDAVGTNWNLNNVINTYDEIIDLRVAPTAEEAYTFACQVYMNVGHYFSFRVHSSGYTDGNAKLLCSAALVR